jgi:hypothetical protein
MTSATSLSDGLWGSSAQGRVLLFRGARNDAVFVMRKVVSRAAACDQLRTRRFAWDRK